MDGPPSRGESQLLTIIVGLPGSGKSHLTAIEAMKDRRLLFYDDCLGGGLPGVKPQLDRLMNAVRLHRPVLANDSLFCLEPGQVDLQIALKPHLTPEYPVRWLYFSNSPERCRRNIERQYRVEAARSLQGAYARRIILLEQISNLSPVYYIPAGAEVIEVVDYSG